MGARSQRSRLLPPCPRLKIHVNASLSKIKAASEHTHSDHASRRHARLRQICASASSHMIKAAWVRVHSDHDCRRHTRARRSARARHDARSKLHRCTLTAITPAAAMPTPEDPRERVVTHDRSCISARSQRSRQRPATPAPEDPRERVVTHDRSCVRARSQRSRLPPPYPRPEDPRERIVTQDRSCVGGR